MFLYGALAHAGFVVLKTRDLGPVVQISAQTVPTNHYRSAGPRALTTMKIFVPRRGGFEISWMSTEHQQLPKPHETHIKAHKDLIRGEVRPLTQPIILQTHVGAQIRREV